MTSMLRRKTAFAFLVGLCLVGCNQSTTVTVTGTVLRDGQPIALGPTGVVQVTLIPDVGPGVEYTTHVGRADATGKFEIIEVPKGKYRVAVEVLDPTPQDDKLAGAHSMENTKIKRDVDGKTPLTIDLAHPDPT